MHLFIKKKTDSSSNVALFTPPSRLGLSDSSLGSGRKSAQSRLLGFVVTAIAKLATYHRELQPRARVSLAKVQIFCLY